MLCMNSVVNFVVVKLINKPAVQQTLENTIFVDNRRAREQTNVLSRETETVVFRNKKCLSPHSPGGSDPSARGKHCFIIPPKKNKSLIYRSQARKKENKQTCFLQRQITQNTNKFITKQGKERGRRLLSLSNTFNMSF